MLLDLEEKWQEADKTSQTGNVDFVCLFIHSFIYSCMHSETRTFYVA